MQNTTFFLKLRSNIILNGDVDVAEREAKSFFKVVERVENPITIETKLALPACHASRHSRSSGCIGFIASSTSLCIQDLVLNLNFIQEIWFEKPDPGKIWDLIENEQWAYLVNEGGKEYICALPLMACGELICQTKIPRPQASDIQNLTAFLAGNTSIQRATFKAPSTGGTSTQHVHSLHKYKAKFFPRLIRSFLVEYLRNLPRNREDKVTLLDPFVGSGTALVESALLNIDCAGVDIDKLSCAISQAKINALTISPKDVARTANELQDAVSWSVVDKPTYKFPKQIAKKFERWSNLEEQLEYERTITKWKNAIADLKESKIKYLFGICLSDALTRKFVIRMLGTGVGRFALEISKTSLDTLMTSNLQTLLNSSYVVVSLIEGYRLTLGKATVHHGSATKLPFDNQSFSIIMTSPPYLPASSGREDYLVGKAISNTALNLMTDEEIEEAEAVSVGSMKSVTAHGDGLPEAVYELHDWLIKDPLREIKAKPILAYYASMKQALEENLRVLLPNGLAVYVVGKESVFYRFKTREVLHQVKCDKIFAEIAESAGFMIEEQIDIELDKKNKNARPRSLDSFFESVFILRKQR